MTSDEATARGEAMPYRGLAETADEQVVGVSLLWPDCLGEVGWCQQDELSRIKKILEEALRSVDKLIRAS